jgi:hypothetical protein
MIPLFIPVVNRMDLLDKAIRSTWKSGVETIVINNSNEWSIPCATATTVYEPPVPLTFAQSQNFMLRQALGYDYIHGRSESVKHPFYLFMHNDSEAGEGTVQKLVAMANAYTIQKRNWGVIFTAYDALAAFNTKAFQQIGGWDQNLEWYHGDTDIYRRLRLAGYEMLESNLPVKHEPSQTLNSDPMISMKVNLMFPCRVNYYRAKWGGDAGNETFITPFNR